MTIWSGSGRRLSDEIAHEEKGRAEATGLLRNVEQQLMRQLLDLDSADRPYLMPKAIAY
jgi:hypothetical protein